MRREFKNTPASRVFGLWHLILVLAVLPFMAAAQFSYSVVNGVITITGYSGPGGEVIIPSNINGMAVTQIGDNAFYTNSSFTQVTLPSSISSIGDSAFRFCSSLTNVTLAQGLTYIGPNAFGGCRRLTNVQLPSSLTGIRSGAFANCTALTSITVPGSVGKVDISTFSGCTQLTNVTLNSGVYYIDLFAFTACSSLASITLPKSITVVEGEAFSYCTALGRVFFGGNKPSTFSSNPPFGLQSSPTIYYLPGTTGWGPVYSGRPTVLWNPALQTSDPNFGVHSNRFGFTITGTYGLPLAIEAASSFAASEWVLLFSGTLTNSSLYFTDPAWTNHPSRFYRLRSP